MPNVNRRTALAQMSALAGAAITANPLSDDSANNHFAEKA